MLARDVAVG